MPAQSPTVRSNEVYETADVGQLLYFLRRRARTIIWCTFLACAVSLFYVLFATPQFTASGVLYLGETQQGSVSDSPGNGMVNLSAYSTESDVETQIELLVTGTLIERSVIETGLNATLRPIDDTPLTYWRWRFLKGGNAKKFVPGPETLQVVNATLVGRYRLVTGTGNTYKIYEHNGFFGVSKPVLTGVIGKALECPAGALLVRIATPDEDGIEERLINTSEDNETVIKPGQVYMLDVVPPDALAQRLTTSALKVTAGGSAIQPSKLVTVQFRWPDPYQAKIFVNQMMNDYISMQMQWKTESASVTEKFVAEQLKKVTEQLAIADTKLSNYQGETGIIDPLQSAQAAVNQIENLKRQRADLVLKMKALRQISENFSGRSQTVNPYLISQTSDPLLANLGTELSQAQQKLSQLEAEYTPSALDIKIQQAQVEQLQKSISSLIKNDLAAATSDLASVDALMSNNQYEMKIQPAESLEVEGLKRSSDQLGELSGLLTQKLEQAQISKAATIIDTRIVTMAMLPLAATSPRLAITVIGGVVAGFMLSLVLVFAKSAISGRYESEEQIRRLIQLQVYGVVPWEISPQIDHEIFGRQRGLTVFNSFREAFKLIKHNIYRQGGEGRGKAILITSSNSRDGKTTIALNLAESLAADDKRVLLLNCDMYIRTLEGEAAFEAFPGLVDWVFTGKRPELKSLPGSSLLVLPAGRTLPNGKVNLEKTGLKKVIETLTGEFDYLILDGPPLPVVADALLLGMFCDLILSVVNVAHTTRHAFELHNELIETLGKPHKLIINGADRRNYGENNSYIVDGFRRWRETSNRLIDYLVVKDSAAFYKRNLSRIGAAIRFLRKISLIRL